MTRLLRLLRRSILAGGALAALLALAGFLGFAVPVLDLLNHVQILLFAATLIVLIAMPWVSAPGRLRNLVIALVATGFVASATIVVPEAVRTLLPRDPLPSDGRPVIRMVTHNLFGLNYDMKRVRDVILAEHPDIVALQEYFVEQRTDLHPLLIEHFPYVAECAGGKRANIALYSRLPFTQIEDGACSEAPVAGQRTAHIAARFDGLGTPFTVVTTHLDWPLPIARKAEQFDELSDVLSTLSGPLIVAGDFNATPWSWGLRNFDRENGLTRHTFGQATFPMRWYYAGGWRPFVPFLPLDQVMTRDGVSVHALHLAPQTGSDHLPVVFDFSVGK